MSQEILGDDYRVFYDPGSQRIHFSGELSLGGMQEYDPIKNLLEMVIAEHHEALTLDLRELYFLNSSGISMLSKFVISMRKVETHLIVLGTDEMPWQKKSLANLKKFLPSLELILN